MRPDTVRESKSPAPCRTLTGAGPHAYAQTLVYVPSRDGLSTFSAPFIRADAVRVWKINI